MGGESASAVDSQHLDHNASVSIMNTAGSVSEHLQFNWCNTIADV